MKGVNQNAENIHNRLIKIFEKSSYTALHEIGHQLSIKKIQDPIEKQEKDNYTKNEILAELAKVWKS